MVVLVFAGTTVAKAMNKKLIKWLHHCSAETKSSTAHCYEVDERTRFKSR